MIYIKSIDDEDFIRKIFSAFSVPNIGTYIPEATISKLDFGFCRAAGFKLGNTPYYIHFHVGQVGEISEPHIRLRVVEANGVNILPEELHFLK